jgi:drug/metabolite transporter (DMT)-like permease
LSISQSVTLPSGTPANAALTGIAFKVVSVLVFLVMSSLLKACDGIPAGELVFFRSSIGIIPVMIFLAWRGQLIEGFKTSSVVGQVWRGLVGTASMATGFFALTKLPLPEAITINYATPLVIVIFGAVFLGENVRLYRWTAVVIGLIGVLIIAWPSLTLINSGVSQEVAIGAISALLSCCFSGVAMLLVRRLVQREKSSTIVLYFLISSSIIALVTVPFGWVMPTSLQAMYLIGAGFAGGIAQILLTESYRHAEMSVVAPFEYSSLIFSVLIGYFFFGDVPTLFIWVGGVIVIGSGLFIIYREHRLGLDRSEARQLSTPQG